MTATPDTMAVHAKTPETAIVVIPPEEVWPPIQAIRSRFDRQFQRWMPHITMVYPFRPISQFDATLPAIRRVCAAAPPITLSLGTFKSFSHGDGRYTMWLDPEPKAALCALQASLMALFPDCDDVTHHAGGFVPHLSVGQMTGRLETEERLKNMEAAWTSLPFVVRSIARIYRVGAQPFRTHDTVSLAG